MPKEEEIKIPSGPAPTGGPTSNEDLIKMQQETFAKKEGEPSEPVTKTKKKEEPPVKDKAEEIFQRAQEQEVNGEDKSAKKPDSDEEEFDGTFPQFDTSRFTEDEKPEPEDEGEPGEDTQTTSVEEPEPPETPQTDFSKEKNITNLRKIAGSFKKERDAALLEAENLKQAIAKTPKPQGLQEEISKLKTRVQELEPYEMVFNLHNNPTFKQKYVEAPNAVVGEMQQIAADYDVDDEVVEQILATHNRRELDSLLDEEFASMSTRMEIKALKQKYDGMVRERMEYEKKPGEALQEFHSKQEQVESRTNQQRDEHLKSLLEYGWGSALNDAAKQPKENRIYEILEQPGKKDHNEKVVQPTLRDAENLYQTGMGYMEKLVRSKGVAGRDFAKWFAQICQQAAATQMVNHVRWGLYNEYQKVMKDKQTQDEHDRPGVSPIGKIVPTPKGGNRKGEEVASSIWSDIVGG